MMRETFDSGAFEIALERGNRCRLCGEKFTVTRDMVASEKAEMPEEYGPMSDYEVLNIIEHCPTCAGMDERIHQIRRIVDTCTMREVEGRELDLFSASAYVQIWDRINPSQREDLDARDLSSAMGVVWAIIEKVNSK